MKGESLDKLNKLTDEIAVMLLSCVKAEMGRKKWQSAYVDVRSPSAGGARIDKLRIIVPDNGAVQGIHVPMDITMVCWEIWQLKAAAFEKAWYGIRVEVTPEGKHTIEYNYDPECINDPTFYDVD